MYDSRTAYLISLVELQLNRRGYYIQREVNSGDRRIDALGERNRKSAKKSSPPVSFGSKAALNGRFSSRAVALSGRDDRWSTPYSQPNALTIASFPYDE